MAVEKQMTPAELSEKVLAEQEEKIQVEKVILLQEKF